MKEFNSTSAQNTSPLGKVFYLAAGLACGLNLFSSSVIPDDICSSNFRSNLQSDYRDDFLKINTIFDGTGGTIPIKSNESFDSYNEIRNFAALFIENIKDVPPEFNKTFRKNFRRLLA